MDGTTFQRTTRNVCLLKLIHRMTFSAMPAAMFKYILEYCSVCRDFITYIHSYFLALAEYW